MSANISALFYLISGILFILALRGLSSPETSRQGNYFGIAGMTIAIVVTFLTVGNFGTGIIYVLIFFYRVLDNDSVALKLKIHIFPMKNQCFFFKKANSRIKT